ncbi:MAG: nucleotidyl transferase AbiEii/AbiGii toxin family protein [Bacteroidales bacterium]|nr:nucleotidyl transferase AbiEii/AbiGii toxin family protein [Bacteroidales bacterium]
MLYLSTIESPTLELLKKLMLNAKLKNMRLAGGTALALHIGHRKSIDLDLFGKIDFNLLEINELFIDFAKVSSIKRSENINIFSINGIKVDFVNYSYSWLQDIVLFNELRLAGMQDIAAMKLAAITGRGSKKDFVDLYFLLNYFTFAQMLGFYKQKYPDGSVYLLMKSLTYFEDAETEPMPVMLTDLSWQSIKDSLLETIKVYNSSLL